MKKNFDAFKKVIDTRGPMKEYMMLRRIRRIDIYNYLEWKGFMPTTFPVRSIKIDLLNSYLYMYDVNNRKIDNDTANTLYPQVYDMVMEIFNNETVIPSKKKRNILVKVSR